MKTLHLYLLRQIIASLVMTMAVFTFFLLLFNLFKEIITPLIQKQVTIDIAAQAIGLLIPFVWVFALPMAMLTATLLVFGRFSADQELTAARAGGISLASLTAPVFIFSLMLCGCSAWFNMEIGPRCRVAYKDLIFKLKAELSSSVQLPEGRFIPDFNGRIVYVGKNRGQQLEDIIIYNFQTSTNDASTIHCPRARFQVDLARKQVTMELFEARIITTSGNREFLSTFASYPITLEFGSEAKQTRRNKIEEMTFSQLQEELRRLEQQVTIPRINNTSGSDNSGEAASLRALTTPLRVQIHRRVATSFACFAFTLVGIPLGIRVHRRETNVGFFIALLLVAAYYGLLVTAQSLDTRPEFYPHLLLWLPNLIFQVAGIFLFWRANRGI